MAKKEKKEDSNSKDKSKTVDASDAADSSNTNYDSHEEKEKKLSDAEIEQMIEDRLPKEIRERFLPTKEKLIKFKEKIIEKFDNYIVAVALLPPKKPEGMDEEEDAKKADEDKDSLDVLVLVDDSDSKKMSKEELKDKLDAIIHSIAKEIDEKIKPFTLLQSELWTYCYDGKYEILQYLSLAAPVYDKGMLAAIKISEVHKTLVLKKFEKYIVAYVLVGSLVQGRATKESDIDVMIVIDDTDVKRMSRTELRDRLRGIIYQMSYEAQEITGIKKPFQIQTYILTDFWESIKDANPVIFTFLRDGAPFYDRGIFMPWKQLLKMGRIKPSQEAIDMLMGAGEQMIKRIKDKLNELGMEDFYYSALYPSQAAIMMYGLPPPTYKETPEVLREVFVKKEKIFEEEYVKIMEKLILWRKDIEHGKKKEITGKEIDELLNDTQKYMKRIKQLFEDIEKKKEAETIIHVHDAVISVTRDLFRAQGMKNISKENLEKAFDAELIKKGILPERFSKVVKEVIFAKEKYEEGKLDKIDMDKLKRGSNEYIKFMVEYMQRKRMGILEHLKVKIKHKEKISEIFFLEKVAFIVSDVQSEDKELKKAKITKDGLKDFEDASFEEFEHAIANADISERAVLNQNLFDDLKKYFNSDIEILLN